jgi:hypothetical protein
VTAVPRPGAPRGGWLVAGSLWLLPVLFGFGMTSWIGFGLIGILVVRIRWVLLAGAWLVVLSWLEIEPDSLPRFVDRVAYGYLEPETDIPLLLMYLAGVAYGVHANRVWLRTLWERRERGVRMLGWSPAPPPVAAAPASSPAAVVPSALGDAPPWTGSAGGAGVAAALVAAHAPVRDERGELLARAASDFRALLAREEQRMRSLLAAAAAGPAPVRAANPTALPTTRLAHTTLLGLPSGPVDVRTASVDEIAAIPAIGPERAALLVAARETRPIASVDDVVEVLGLTAVDLVRARSYLRF